MFRMSAISFRRLHPTDFPCGDSIFVEGIHPDIIPFHIGLQDPDLHLVLSKYPEAVVKRAMAPQHLTAHGVPPPAHLHGHAVRAAGGDLGGPSR